MMKYNYHTHTWRCRHASGTERGYIENAIAEGMKVLGFADHVPYPFKGDYYSNFRMFVEQTEDYATTLAALREEYKGQIDIKIGYEAEYYPMFFKDMLRLVTSYPCDYLILGQHYIENEVTAKHSGVATTDEGKLRTYVDEVIAAMETGLFTYVAHPDFFNFEGDTGVYRRELRRLAKRAAELDIPMEINLLGLRAGRNYPSSDFFALCGEVGAPVCIGCDAHTADTVRPGKHWDEAMAIVERYGLRFVENPILRPVVL